MQKLIYKWTQHKNEEIEKTEISKDEAGSEIKVTKKITEKIPYSYGILKPSRRLRDDCDEFRVIQESRYIQMGVLTYEQLIKRIMNDNGLISEPEKKERIELLEKFIKLQSDYSELYNIKEIDRTDEQKKKMTESEEELGKIVTRIQEIDNVGSGIFEKSAEGLSRNKAILYMTLFSLVKVLEEDKFELIFKGKTFDDKLSEYDALEERENDYEYELVKKAMLVTGANFLGKAATKEDFDLLLKLSDNQNLLNI